MNKEYDFSKSKKNPYTKMYILELTYIKSLEEVNRLLNEHRLFLERYYQAGIFIASGPKEPRRGGVILVKPGDFNIQKIVKEDPFYIEGIAEYKVIEFIPNRYQKEFEQLISK